MQRHDWSSTSQKDPMLHLSLSPCTGYRLQLASSSKHWCLYIEQLQAQYPPTYTHWWQSTSPPEVWDPLVSDASWDHHREAQSHFPEHYRSPLLAGGMTFLPPSGILESLSTFKQELKTLKTTEDSFNTTWLHPKFPPPPKKKTVFLFIYLSCYLVLIWTMPETWYYEHKIMQFPANNFTIWICSINTNSAHLRNW